MIKTKKLEKNLKFKKMSTLYEILKDFYDLETIQWM